MSERANSNRAVGGQALRVGVIGAGFMGSIHLKALKRIQDSGLLPIRVSAVADHNAAKAALGAKPFKAKTHAEGLALVADPDVDAVVIVAQTHQHLPLVKAAVKAGKPVFLEKPLGRNQAEVEEIARLLAAAPAPHQIGLVLRHSPTYNVLKSLLADPKNGEFVFCRFRDDQAFPIGAPYGSTWRGDVKQAGGGALIEHSIHDVDALIWFFGEPVVTDAHIAPSHLKGIERLAALNMKFPGGGSAQLASVWHKNPARENEREIEIFFENRYFRTDGGYVSPIRVEGPRGAARVLDKEEIEKRFRKMIHWNDKNNADFPSTSGYELFLWMRAALGGATDGLIGVDTGVRAHRVIDAAYRMSKTGK